MRWLLFLVTAFALFTIALFAPLMAQEAKDPPGSQSRILRPSRPA